MDYPRVYAGQDALTPGTQRTTDFMVETLERSRPELIADVACEKGLTACDPASRLGCRVLAFDRMPAFLTDARRRVHDGGLSDSVGAVAADGKHLPLPDAICDAASCLGAPTIVGVPEAFEELARITEPEGVVVVSDAMVREPAVDDPSLPAEFAALGDLPAYLSGMEGAGLRVEATHLHPIEDWIDYFAPLRRTVEHAHREGDATFADEVQAMIDEEWAAARTALDYVTVVAHRA